MWTLFLAAHASMRWYALRNHASTRRPGSLTLEAPSRNSSAFRRWVSSEDIRVLITRQVLKHHGEGGRTAVIGCHSGCSLVEEQIPGWRYRRQSVWTVVHLGPDILVGAK